MTRVDFRPETFRPTRSESLDPGFFVERALQSIDPAVTQSHQVLRDKKGIPRRNPFCKFSARHREQSRDSSRATIPIRPKTRRKGWANRPQRDELNLAQLRLAGLQSLGKESSLGFHFGEFERLSEITGSREWIVHLRFELPEHGVKQIIRFQLIAAFYRGNRIKTSLRPMNVRHRDRTIESHDRRIVELH